MKGYLKKINVPLKYQVKISSHNSKVTLSTNSLALKKKKKKGWPALTSLLQMKNFLDNEYRKSREPLGCKQIVKVTCCQLRPGGKRINIFVRWINNWRKQNRKFCSTKVDALV